MFDPTTSREWTAQDYVLIFGSLTALITTVIASIAAAVGTLLNHWKQVQLELKLDQNTLLTEAAKKSADNATEKAMNAENKAAMARAVVITKIDAIQKATNGLTQDLVDSERRGARMEERESILAGLDAVNTLVGSSGSGSDDASKPLNSDAEKLAKLEGAAEERERSAVEIHGSPKVVDVLKNATSPANKDKAK